VLLASSFVPPDDVAVVGARLSCALLSMNRGNASDYPSSLGGDQLGTLIIHLLTIDPTRELTGSGGGADLLIAAPTRTVVQKTEPNKFFALEK